MSQATTPHPKQNLILVIPDPTNVLKPSSVSASNAAGVAVAVAATAVTSVGVFTVAVPIAAMIGTSLAVRYGWKYFNERGVRELNIQKIAKSQTKDLVFPSGHPRERVIYVAHPIDNNIYYPAAQFHRLTFEHKVLEAVRLMESLGANQIEVESQEGWSSEFIAGVDLRHTEMAYQTGISSQQSSGRHMSWKATYEVKNEPSIPSNTIWYPRELTWQQVAESRLKYGMKDVSLNVRYDDDFGISASIGAKLLGTGFDLGGNFVQHQSTIWRIHGMFDD
jgi:hypothetical protein